MNISTSIRFSKYQGTGNDFILIDNRLLNIKLSKKQIEDVCHRRFGVGADGLMYLQNVDGYDFEMVYYNSDGADSSFCGNGSRCITQFAYDLGIIKNEAKFLFGSSTYTSRVDRDVISVDMQDVSYWEKKTEDILTLDTGSPHYVVFTSNIDNFDLLPFAKSIRYSSEYSEGINVNIVEVVGNNHIKMRTYERGVEDETYSCGTGVTAAAIAYNLLKNPNSNDIQVTTKGGELRVTFDPNPNIYKDIKLIGPATFVYKGEYLFK